MELVSPSLGHAESFQEILDEIRGTKDMGFWDEIGSPKSIQDYIRLRLHHAEGKDLPDGWIPATTYWLIDDGAVIGETTIRHRLTEHLRNVGGQIGYWIRPSKRGQGYGTHILQLALQKTKDMGIERIVITCDETNERSRKIIEKNGGVFERVQDMGPDAPKKLLFWIETID